MGDCLCDRCAALCCRYFALPIDNPETAKQFDDIRWYLIHENVVVFVEAGQWYLGVLNRCKHLRDDNRCGIYDTRPNVCREYSTDRCEYHGGDYGYEHLFVSAEQLEAHASRVLAEAAEAKKLKRAKQRHRARLDAAKLLRAGTAAGKANGGEAVPLTVRGRRPAATTKSADTPIAPVSS